MIGLVLALAALGAMWGALALLLGPHRWVVAGSPRTARPEEDDESEGEGDPVSREAEDWATADWLVGEVEKEAAEQLAPEEGVHAPEKTKTTEKGEGDDD